MKNNNSNSYRHTLKYAGLFGGVQGLNVLIGLVRNKLVAIILGPAGMGLVSLYNSVVTLLSTATSMGMSMSGVKNVSEAYDAAPDSSQLADRVKLVRSLCLALAFAGILLCVLFSHVLSQLVFGDSCHKWSFVALAPVVGMTTMMTGELSIMKGARMLRSIAQISIVNVVAALIISIPLFYFYGTRGIIPSFLFLTTSQFAFSLHYSCKRFPWRVSMRMGFLKKGSKILRLGIAFVLAGVFGTGADFLIRQFLNQNGSLDAVGLYNAGYMLTMVYGGLVFSAMETDFFPRLSAVAPGNIMMQNDVVNKQIEVSLILISPMLTAFITFLPVIVPLLFSHKFIAVISMSQVIVIAMYLRALRLPMSYIALAKSDSRSFLFLEGMYAVVEYFLVCLMFKSHGLLGAGYALVLTAVFDFTMLTIYTYYKYRFKLSRGVVRLSLVMLPLGIASYSASVLLHGAAYWIVGILLAVLTIIASLFVLHRKTHLMSALKKKIGQKFGR